MKNPIKSVPKNVWIIVAALGVGYYFTEIFIGIRMNSNQSNHSDGSFHIRETPLPKRKSN